MANKPRGVLYIGVTNDLVRRVYERKNNLEKGFTQKYNVHSLVYWTQTNDIESAIRREKHLKNWNRQWKIKLLEKTNPDWRDLYWDLL